MLERAVMLEVGWHHAGMLWWKRVFFYILFIVILLVVVAATAFALKVGRSFVLVRLAILCLLVVSAMMKMQPT